MSISRSRAAQLAAVVLAGLVAVLALGQRQHSSLADARYRATTAEETSVALAANDAALREAIDAWRAGGDPPTAPPPPEVMSMARYLQEEVRSLARQPSLADSTIALLPGPLAGSVREMTIAQRDLDRLSAGWPDHKVKTGEPEPLANLMRYYDAAHRRHGIHQHFLAAVNLVESKFGRVKNNSVAGAQGPMQFIPSTWDIYGHGSIQDPHDAILAAANLLHDNGAPADYGDALFAYNPSRLYVDAVKRYARVIRSDAYAIYFLYCWGP